MSNITKSSRLFSKLFQSLTKNKKIDFLIKNQTQEQKKIFDNGLNNIDKFFKQLSENQISKTILKNIKESNSLTKNNIEQVNHFIKMSIKETKDLMKKKVLQKFEEQIDGKFSNEEKIVIIKLVESLYEKMISKLPKKVGKFLLDELILSNIDDIVTATEKFINKNKKKSDHKGFIITGENPDEKNVLIQEEKAKEISHLKDESKQIKKKNLYKDENLDEKNALIQKKTVKEIPNSQNLNEQITKKNLYSIFQTSRVNLTKENEIKTISSFSDISKIKLDKQKLFETAFKENQNEKPPGQKIYLTSSVQELFKFKNDAKNIK